MTLITIFIWSSIAYIKTANGKISVYGFIMNGGNNSFFFSTNGLILLCKSHGQNGFFFFLVSEGCCHLILIQFKIEWILWL